MRNKPKGRVKRPTRSPLLCAWLRCYASDDKTAAEALRRAHRANEGVLADAGRAEKMSFLSSLKKEKSTLPLCPA